MTESKAYLKKEWLEFKRTHRLLAFCILFAVFAIMGPATAKLTPLLFEAFQADLETQGMQLVISEPVAMDSYMQFFKNLPILLIIVIILFSGSFTGEFTKGTGVLMLTKGLSKRKMLFTKYILWMLTTLGGIFLYLAIFMGYTAYYFKLTNLGGFFAAAGIYLIYIWFWLSLLLLMSVIIKSAGIVILGMGAVYFILSLIAIIPNAEHYLPTGLSQGVVFVADPTVIKDFLPAILITCCLNIVLIIASALLVPRKKV